MVTVKCPHCGAENAGGSAFCAGCGKALPSATPAGPRVVTGEAIAATSSGRGVQEDQLRKQTKQASGALFVVAALSVIGGFLGYFLVRNIPAVKPSVAVTILVVNLVLAGLYAAFGVWARANPLPAAIAGLVLFVSVTVLDAVANPMTLASGLLVKIIIIVALAKAVRAGLRYRQFKAQAGNPAGPAGN